MELAYTLTPDDAKAGTRYMYWHQRGWRTFFGARPVLLAVYYTFLTILVWFPLAVEWSTPLFLRLVAGYLVFAAFFFLVIDPWSLSRKGSRVFVKQYGRALTCVLRVTPEGLTETTGVSETRLNWNAVGDVVAAESHTFINLANGVGCVAVPRRGIKEGEIEAFCEAVETYRCAARSASPPAPVVG